MAIKVSKGREGSYAKYKTSNTQAANRKRKLERTLKKQPNNEQVKLALKDIHYRRRIPTSPFWSHQMIATASMLKQFTGVFNKEVFSTIPETHSSAIRARNTNLFPVVKKLDQKNVSMFSLGQRAHNKEGQLVWS